VGGLGLVSEDEYDGDRIALLVTSTEDGQMFEGTVAEFPDVAVCA
jgi:hypothetical protein